MSLVVPVISKGKSTYSSSVLKKISVGSVISQNPFEVKCTLIFYYCCLPSKHLKYLLSYRQSPVLCLSALSVNIGEKGDRGCKD